MTRPHRRATVRACARVHSFCSYRSCSLAALLTVWEWQTRLSPQSAFLFGSPSAIGRFLWQGLADGTLLRDAGVTALETGLGFLIGNIVGTLAGLSLWYSTFVSRVVQPFIVAIGSIPIIALAPIIIIWFGTGSPRRSRCRRSRSSWSPS
ncbi:ABC transporter permease [Methylobacterium oryzae CBMB20]